MKKALIVIIIILIMNSLEILATRKDTSQVQMQQKYPLTFMIMISTPEEEKQANVLIKSISTFGGIYSSAPIIIVLSDTIRTKGESLKGKVMEIVKLEMDETSRRFPFSDKVYACAQVEKMMENRTEWLVWLNPDALLVAPPTEIMADRNAWASLRPVHIKNIGLGCTEAITDYWGKIYQQTGVDTNAVWLVESYVDNKILRPYYNSGCMAFRADISILREWKRVYKSLLHDKDTYAYYSSVNYGAFFFHQAVLSEVVVKKAGKDRINILPPSSGYPLSLHNHEEFISKKHSVSEMKIILCEKYENIQWLTVEEPYRTWLQRHIQ